MTTKFCTADRWSNFSDHRPASTPVIPISSEAIRPNQTIRATLATPSLAKGRTHRAVTRPTATPRVAAPRVKPTVSSSGLSGGVRKSVAVPMILAWIRLDEALAKAFCRMAIMIRPGATNSANGVPCSGGRAPFSATTKTSM
ncbi:hypothetical protein D3C81_1347330 [compost metagenome]